jgi:excisionase family DNA binding protein
MEQLLSVKEVAKKLACTEAAIREWLYLRQLPAGRVGRLVRVRESVVDEVMNHGLRLPMSRSASR